MIEGKIHSFETFGLADGPGVRFIVFLQGCNFRCKYCHNPDTWSLESNDMIKMEPQSLIKKALRFRSYWNEDGGITVSGGEPLLQIDFLIEFFKLCKENNVHTTIDTAGGPFTLDDEFKSKFDELMKYTDLIMLDIKHIDPIKHKELTGFSNENVIMMLNYLNEINKDVWIRHVLVNGITDNENDWNKINELINDMKNIKRVDVLPYHTYGEYKYEKMGMKYPLKDLLPPTNELVEKAKKVLEKR